MRPNTTTAPPCVAYLRAVTRESRFLRDVLAAGSLAASLLLVFAAAPLQAGEADEASIEILRDSLRTNKKAIEIGRAHV